MDEITLTYTPQDARMILANVAHCPQAIDARGVLVAR
jgi:hypothetical protein